MARQSAIADEVVLGGLGGGQNVFGGLGGFLGLVRRKNKK
jgi:hypothetical protein